MSILKERLAYVLFHSGLNSENSNYVEDFLRSHEDLNAQDLKYVALSLSQYRSVLESEFNIEANQLVVYLDELKTILLENTQGGLKWYYSSRMIDGVRNHISVLHESFRVTSGELPEFLGALRTFLGDVQEGSKDDSYSFTVLDTLNVALSTVDHLIEKNEIPNYLEGAKNQINEDKLEGITSELLLISPSFVGYNDRICCLDGDTLNSKDTYESGIFVVGEVKFEDTLKKIKLIDGSRVNYTPGRYFKVKFSEALIKPGRENNMKSERTYVIDVLNKNHIELVDTYQLIASAF
ncbi:MAG: hypothetical protein GOU98_04725 [Candidatus Altiarchaeota archaeon]|nr:hypothetical protein [Candidatus Altiarchaeota archaeon]